MSGYFVVHRQVFDHVDFADEPFTEREAWLWLISEAAWKPKTVRVGSAGGTVTLERGEIAHSLRFLAEKWQWSVKRVRGFLDRSEKTGRISRKRAHDGAVLTICNYDKFQLGGHTEGQSEGTRRAHEGHKEEELKKERKIDDDDGAAPLISEDANRVADSVAKICGHDLGFLPPAWLGAPYRVQSWLAQGWPEAIILTSCREQMAKKRDGPPDRIQYFEKGIAGAIAKANAPLPEVKIIEAQKVEVRRGATENLVDTARRLAGSGVQLGPRPSLMGGGEDGNLVRLLPPGRGERPGDVHDGGGRDAGGISARGGDLRHRPEDGAATEIEIPAIRGGSP